MLNYYVVQGGMKRYTIGELLAVRNSSETEKVDASVRMRLKHLKIFKDGQNATDKIVLELTQFKKDRCYKKHKNYLRRQRAKAQRKRSGGEERRKTVPAELSHPVELFAQKQVRHSIIDFVELSEQFERLVIGTKSSVAEKGAGSSGSKIQSRVMSRRGSIDC